MIAKISKGSSFGGLLKYLSKSEQKEKQKALPNYQQISEVIGGNMYGINSQELFQEFRVSRQLNSNCQKPVFHVSLTLPLDEKLDQDTWNEVAEQYLERMGFTDNQYTIFQHRDTPYEHIHIIASTIQLGDGKVVDSGWDHLRSMNIVRRLEQEYGLQQIEQISTSKRVNRGLIKQIARQQQEYETGKQATPPEQPLKFQLQQQIEQAASEQPTMSKLFERLMVAGIEVRHQSIDKSKGISYQFQGVACSGTQLGAAYTWPGLQKYLKVDYQADRDEPQIQQLYQLGVSAVQKQQNQGLSEKIDRQAQQLNQQSSALQQKLADLTTQQQLIDRYLAINPDELQEWQEQATAIGRSSEYLERITEMSQTLRDWQSNRSIGWEKLQGFNLESIQQQMASDKGEYQQMIIAQEQDLFDAKILIPEPEQRQSRSSGLEL
jgi:Relaxase/Mobilisation nuclease domain